MKIGYKNQLTLDWNLFTRNLIYDYQYRYATFKCSLHFWSLYKLRYRKQLLFYVC